MANHPTRTLPVEVEFEFSRLASQDLSDAYAQVLPEIHSTTMTPKTNKLKRASIKEAQS